MTLQSTLFRNGALLLIAAAWLLATPVAAERIKDLTSISGVRLNQLIGYGLVVGLNGTGDKDTDSPYTLNSLRNMLTQFGVQIPPGVKIKPKNVAAVIVHGNLPPFSKIGQEIDITVSSLGNAQSLRGGTLLMTPLKGADGRNYALAQGNLVVGGLTASGQDGSKVTVNIPSAGRIPNGATVEREVVNHFGKGRSITLNLNDGDFTTAMRVAQSINLAIGPGTAKPLDATSIRVNAPMDPGQKVSFIAMLEELQVRPGSAPAKVIINSRTGTVVINSQVRVYPAAVSHGNLVVSISENAEVSQPGAFSGGQTAVVPQSDVGVTEEANHMFLFDPGVSLDEVVRAVNEVGAAPSDLVAILEALKEAGALRAELIVI
ncbi:flagellar biosynthesis protein FlgI [bacterium endosymbiont of Escarpia laminata]|nr:MAG: flagellar biosynthesis protein FlgI [bacterium endosymbiont of Escarpia laminata]